jgi:hypothetical protein
VIVLSASDAWAVGQAYPASQGVTTLIEHWDGTSWSVVPTPNVGQGSNLIEGIPAVSSGDVWSGGQVVFASASAPLEEHWDGTKWTPVSAPSAGDSNDILSLAAVATDDVWAAGLYSAGFAQPLQTLVEHWDGAAWTISDTPNVGTKDNSLYGIDTDPAGNAWAVGSWMNAQGHMSTLAEQYCPGAIHGTVG